MMFPKLDEQEVGRKPRNPNVFKLWQIDTPDVLDQCFRSDFDGWKLAKFVKDTVEQAKIKELVRENYLFLKEVYMSISSNSNFPFITSLDFGTLMENC